MSKIQLKSAVIWLNEKKGEKQVIKCEAEFDNENQMNNYKKQLADQYKISAANIDFRCIIH